MKQCPQCQRAFSDENLFCLSDGTQLLFDAPEEATVIKPFGTIRPPLQPVASQGVSPMFAYLAVGLLALVIGGAVILLLTFIFTSSNAKGEIQNVSSTATESKANQDQQSNQQKNLQDEQALLEKERQKLADERRKLEAQKNKIVVSPSVNTAQPTARINFRKGNAQETISGSVAIKRSFVLRANAGQYMWASLNSGNGCVAFSNGSTDIGFTTIKGDNSVTIINNCDNQVNFNFTVSIR